MVYLISQRKTPKFDIFEKTAQNFQSGLFLCYWLEHVLDKLRWEANRTYNILEWLNWLKQSGVVKNLTYKTSTRHFIKEVPQTYVRSLSIEVVYYVSDIRANDRRLATNLNHTLKGSLICYWPCEIENMTDFLQSTQAWGAIFM